MATSEAEMKVWLNMSIWGLKCEYYILQLAMMTNFLFVNQALNIWTFIACLAFSVLNLKYERTAVSNFLYSAVYALMPIVFITPTSTDSETSILSVTSFVMFLISILRVLIEKSGKLKFLETVMLDATIIFVLVLLRLAVAVVLAEKIGSMQMQFVIAGFDLLCLMKVFASIIRVYVKVLETPPRVVTVQKPPAAAPLSAEDAAAAPDSDADEAPEKPKSE